MVPAIVTLLSTLIPDAIALWEQIRAENADLNLQPASAFLTDAQTRFQQVETTAATEVAKG